jgi:hypothetical protein
VKQRIHNSLNVINFHAKKMLDDMAHEFNITVMYLMAATLLAPAASAVVVVVVVV